MGSGRVVEAVRAVSGRRTTPDRVTNGKNVLDRDRVRAETVPKPTPISPDAVIWERSVCCVFPGSGAVKWYTPKHSMSLTRHYSPHRLPVMSVKLP